MKSSSLFLLSGAALGLAKPVMDVVIETDVYYYTVTQEVTTVETVPAEAPVVNANLNVEATSSLSTSAFSTPVAAVVTVTVGASAAAVTSEAAATSVAPAATVEAASSSVVEDASTASPSDFASTATYHHNIHRTNNSAPSMTYGDTYASYASQVAASCKFAHDLTPGGGNYGQNIAMYAATDADSMSEELAIAQAITQMWYNGEVDLYPSSSYGQANPDFSDFEGWGHYSQMVWVGSNQVGCAAQYCPAGTMEPDMASWFSVCNYYPAGNVDGEYGDNVLAPGSGATVTVDISI